MSILCNILFLLLTINRLTIRLLVCRMYCLRGWIKIRFSAILIAKEKSELAIHNKCNLNINQTTGLPGFNELRVTRCWQLTAVAQSQMLLRFVYSTTVSRCPVNLHIYATAELIFSISADIVTWISPENAKKLLKNWGKLLPFIGRQTAFPSCRVVVTLAVECRWLCITYYTSLSA